VFFFTWIRWSDFDGIRYTYFNNYENHVDICFYMTEKNVSMCKFFYNIYLYSSPSPSSWENFSSTPLRVLLCFRIITIIVLAKHILCTYDIDVLKNRLNTLGKNNMRKDNSRNRDAMIRELTITRFCSLWL